jgi:hypothetical protein
MNSKDWSNKGRERYIKGKIKTEVPHSGLDIGR